MAEERDDDGWSDASVEAGMAAVGAMFGAALGGPVGAVAGAALTPLGVQAFNAIGERWTAQRQRQGAGVIVEAAARLGVAEPELAELAGADPQRLKLAGDTIAAAAGTVMAAKVRALGRALAQGLADDGAQVDHEQLIVQALAAIEAPHVKLLAAFTRPNWDRPFGPGQWSVREIGERHSAVAPSAAALIATLERAGLLLREPPDLEGTFREYDRYREDDFRRPLGFRPQDRHEPKWRITDLGQEVLAYLEVPEQKALEDGIAAVD